MLNTVEHSRAKKTAGLAVTYRAAPGDMYGTCPDTCPLKPAATSTTEIDREYEAALRAGVPKRGQAYLYTHFPPSKWAEQNTGAPGQAVFNYSATSTNDAAEQTRHGVASVAVVPANYWDRRASHKVMTDGRTRGVRCPAELRDISCVNCGNGRPLCARPERDYFVIFTAHGASKRKAGDNADPGGCYAGGGNVALHWRGLASKAEPAETDAEQHKRFARSLPPGSILRPHIAGDMGRVK
jgi:hypothetical protein